jgi:hypothetical protein
MEKQILRSAQDDSRLILQQVLIASHIRCIEHSCVPQTPLRTARANRVSGTDKKRIRTENAVMAKSNSGLGLLLYQIVDCMRTASSSVRNR